MDRLVTKFAIVGLISLFYFVQHSAANYGEFRPRRQVVFPDDDEPIGSTSGPVIRGDCDNSPVGIGRCVKITDCPRLLREPNYNRLRRFVCGYERFEPRVCCPINNRPTPRPVPTPTQRPRPRPTPTERPTSRPRPTPTVRPTPRPRPPVTPVNPDRQEDKPRFLPRECGRSNVTARRIVGGHESEAGAWPWIVALYIEERGVKSADCGGALVTPDTVITAAHCVTKDDGKILPATAFTARLGEHDLNQDNDEAVDIPVTTVKRHENFDRRTYKNDIAVLKLARKATFSSRIQPVCLPYDSLRTDNLVDRKAFVAGWGTTEFNGPSSNVLMEVEIPVWEEGKCRTTYRNDVPITNEYLCAGTEDGDKDSCQGDSGGPLVMVGRESRYYLMGVVSFGKRCATPGFPGVYANVRMFLPWITRNAA